MRSIKIILSILLYLLSSQPLHAKVSPFVEEFIENYRNRDLKRQELLITTNKDKVLSEAEALVKEAMSEGKGFEERMFLLDIASSMVTMYKYRFGDGEALLSKINTLIKEEALKERRRIMELMRWKPEERFLGNFVMKRREKEMRKEGLPPVIYPHWIHRIYFKCKVCHNGIFMMRRWVNEISQKEIEAGKQCGICHNGKIAFDGRRNCRRCHIAGTQASERLRDPDRIDHREVKEVAERIGAEWNYERLPDGKIPRDRFGFIDWLALKEKGVFRPISSLSKGSKEEVRDNKILFITKGASVKNVLFDHKIHSSWIDCSACHPMIFKDRLGENEIWMKDMADGESCGHCHGKVSFTFADCLRCHSQPRDKIPPGVLVHRPKAGRGN